MVSKAIDIYIDQRVKNQLIINFLIEINNADIFYQSLDKIITNINDIILDSPDANEKIIFLINTTKYNHSKKITIINVLNNLENSDDETNNEDTDND